MDSPNPLLADHFPNPFWVAEQTPFGIEKDQSAMTDIVDWKETSDEHVIMMGVVSVLRVIGERKKEQENKSDRWHRVERMCGKFWRQLRLPENVDLDSIKTKMEDGVLTLTFFII
ncbi:putative small heat shock protein HSP20 [Medicago truncatula]|uniref:Putative small heat shock protein HSP20 n=1 Tax=Medicago truncatula TaxID=3880 RepID=A0A396HRT7_MEDTR|nr:putative small heat shock protein HSP20 [Medicago truncatula]